MAEETLRHEVSVTK